MPSARTRLAAAVAASVIASAATAQHAVPTFRELATEPKDIVLGTVTEVKAIDPPAGRGIPVTRVTMAVHAAIAGDARPGQSIELLQLGGTAGDRGASVCCSIDWERGQTYLAFLADRRTPSVHPTVGGYDGVFRIVADDSGRHFPLAYGFRPVRGVRDGRLALASRASAIVEGRARIEREPLPAMQVRDLDPDGRAWSVELPESVEAWDLQALVGAVAAARGERPVPLPPLPSIAPIPAAAGLWPSLCYCGYDQLFQVFEQVPRSWSTFASHESLMARYNRYVDFFRYTEDDGGFANDNWQNEFCGAVPDSVISSEYTPFTWGNVIGLCISDPTNCGPISESDIMVNPASSFLTAWDESIMASDGPFCYETVIVHELGHSLGLQRSGSSDPSGGCGPEQYVFAYPTVMAGMSRAVIDDGRGIHRGDAKVLRTVYAGQSPALPLQDIGIESFYADGTHVASTLASGTVAQGDQVVIQNLYVENVSTSAVAGVRLRVYLSSNRTISTSDRQLGDDVDLGTVPFDSAQLLNIERRIPFGVAPGTYFVGVRASVGGDAHLQDDVWENDAVSIVMPLEVVAGSNQPSWDVTPTLRALNEDLAVRWYQDTTFAFPDPDPPYCGSTPMGPGGFTIIDVPEDGQLEVGLQAAEGDAPAFTASADMVAVYGDANGAPGQLLGARCATATSGPLTVPVEAGRRYHLRAGAVAGSSVAGWFQARVLPARPFGSSPGLALRWRDAFPRASGAMPPVQFQLPCAQASVRGTWFRWRAPAAGTLKASTCRGATDFAHVVSIHRSSPDLAVAACGSGGAPAGCANPFGTVVTASVQPGELVYVRVGQAGQQGGTFELDLSLDAQAAPNAACSGAAPVSVGAHPFATEAGGTGGAPGCAGVADARAVWFRFDPASAGTLVASTCADIGANSGQEVAVSIHRGSCDAAAEGCGTDPCGGPGGARVAAVAGQPLFIRVAARSFGFGPRTANGLLGIDFKAACQGDLDSDGTVAGGDLGILLAKWGQQVPPGSPDASVDLNADGTVNGADLGVMLSRWGPCQAQ